MTNLLDKTKTYLVGHMQYVSGRNWREEVASKLNEIGITCFDPYKKPFIKDVEEDEATRQEMETWMKTKQYDRVTDRMKTVRAYDLNLVDSWYFSASIRRLIKNNKDYENEFAIKASKPF